ncbi:hypothetical protein Sjap_000820 [Stephania japonica]|uniref:Uncharacterized protein n=1 Tax=Stephania japonica TaxID=461633 RepID=A0AAP0PSS9_9MAGN
MEIFFFTIEARRCPQLHLSHQNVINGVQAQYHQVGEKEKSRESKVQPPAVSGTKADAVYHDFRPTTPGNSPGVGHCSNNGH